MLNTGKCLDNATNKLMRSRWTQSLDIHATTGILSSFAFVKYLKSLIKDPTDGPNGYQTLDRKFESGSPLNHAKYCIFANDFCEYSDSPLNS